MALLSLPKNAAFCADKCGGCHEIATAETFRNGNDTEARALAKLLKAV